MNLNTYNTCADKQFRVKAFAEYCQRKADSYEKLFTALGQTVAAVPDDEESVAPQNAETIIDEIATSNNLDPDQYLLCNSGYIKLRDLLLARYNSVIADADGDTESDSTADAVTLIYANGQEAVNTSIDNIIDEIKTNYHSVVATSAALFASYAETAADKVSEFRDRMSEKFSNAFSDYSNVSSLYVTRLRLAASPADMFQQIIGMMSVDRLADDDTTFVPENSDFFKYTGASPVGPLCFDNVTSAIGSVVNAGVKVVAGIVSTVGGWLSSAWNWLTRTITEVVADPNDLEAIDKSANSYTIQNFHWQWKDQYTLVSWYDATGELNAPTQERFQSVLSELARKQGKWVKYKTFFSEHLYRINKVTGTLSSDGLFTVFRVEYDELCRLRCITREAVNSFLLNRCNLQQVSSSYVKATIKPDDGTTGLEAVSNVYCDVDSSERELFLGFAYSAFMFRFLTQASITGSSQQGASTNTLNLSDPISNFIYEGNLPNVITNADFIYAACGYIVSADQYAGVNIPFADKYSLFTWVDVNSQYQYNGSSYYFSAFIANAAHEIDNPLDPIFFPYLSGVEGFDSPRFNIKTDETNRNAFNTFITTAVAVVIIAVVAVSAVVVAKKISKALTIKREQRLASINAKMWNGESLTKKEKRKLYRAIKKSSAGEAVTAGLLSNSFSSEADSDSNQLASTILSLLK